MTHVIIGAGLSGMVAAWRALQTDSTTPANVRLLESANRPGGLMGTQTLEGFRLETGPHTFPGRADRIVALCRELGLSPLTASGKHRYVVKQGRLCEAPTNPLTFLRSPLLTVSQKARLLVEPWQVVGDPDASIAAFIRRRLGQGALDYLINPLLTGIYAGDPEQLSMAAVFPNLMAWEQQYGSLLGGVAQSLRQRRQAMSTAKPMSAFKRSALLGFEGGMQILVDALADRVKPILTCGVSVSRCSRLANGRYEVLTESPHGPERLLADRLTMAIPAYESARLLRNIAPTAADALAAIPYAPVRMIHIGFKRGCICHPLDGFGFLVPTLEQVNTPMLGCIWASSLFTGRAPDGYVLLTVLAGGMTQPLALSQPVERQLPGILNALSHLLGASGKLRPELVHTIDWPQAIPQYTVGHMERIAQATTGLRDQPVTLLGNYRNGVALNHLL